jgi:hypothetical protein
MRGYKVTVEYESSENDEILCPARPLIQTHGIGSNQFVRVATLGLERWFPSEGVVSMTVVELNQLDIMEFIQEKDLPELRNRVIDLRRQAMDDGDVDMGVLADLADKAITHFSILDKERREDEASSDEIGKTEL